MLRPKLRAMRSMPSRSSFAGKRAAISAYPGRKSTMGSPSTVRMGLLLRKGRRMKRSVNRTSTMTVLRSAGKDGFGLMFLFTPTGNVRRVLEIKILPGPAKCC
jgi:hypothetical protein